MPEEVLHTLSFEEVPMEEPRLTWEELSRLAGTGLCRTGRQSLSFNAA